MKEMCGRVRVGRLSRKLSAAGFAANRVPKAAPTCVHVDWLGCGAQQKFAGKTVFMYETVDNSLADRIQNLVRSPKVVHGLLPLFGTPSTDVWVPLGVCVLLSLENLLWTKLRDYTISRVNPNPSQAFFM